MDQKRHRRPSPSDGCRSAPRDYSARSRGSLRCGLVHGPTLGFPSQGPAARSRRLERSIATPQANATHESGHRTQSSRRSTAVEGTQCSGRIWRRSHLSENAMRPRQYMPFGANDRTDSPTKWRLGRQAPPTASSTASRMVFADFGRRQSRAGQFRHDRRPGDPRRPAFVRFDRNIASRRIVERLAGTVDFGQIGRREARRTLARSGAARLCSIRQRSTFHRPATVPGHRWKGVSIVFAVVCGSRFRTTQRNGFSGGHRKLQRTLAIQGLGEVRTQDASYLAESVGQIRYSDPRAKRGTHRIGTASAPVSQTLATRSAEAPAGDHRLHSAYQRQRLRQHAGPMFPRGSSLAASSGSCGSRSVVRCDSNIRTPPTRTHRATPAQSGAIRTPKKKVYGVTGMY